MLLLKADKKHGNLMINMTPFSIAGAQYDNADGTSRQKILAGCTAIFEADLVPGEYDGQFAIKVTDHRSKEQIGWVPKNQLPQFAGMTRKARVTGIVRKTKAGLFYAQLSEAQSVEPELYRSVRDWCKEAGIDCPAYDQRAYMVAAEWINANMKKAAQTVPAR